jgi:hypothetical protein
MVRARGATILKNFTDRMLIRAMKKYVNNKNKV